MVSLSHVAVAHWRGRARGAKRQALLLRPRDGQPVEQRAGAMCMMPRTVVRKEGARWDGVVSSAVENRESKIKRSEMGERERERETTGRGKRDGGAKNALPSVIARSVIDD